MEGNPQGYKGFAEGFCRRFLRKVLAKVLRTVVRRVLAEGFPHKFKTWFFRSNIVNKHQLFQKCMFGTVVNILCTCSYRQICDVFEGNTELIIG